MVANNHSVAHNRPTSSLLNLDLDYLDLFKMSIFTDNHSIEHNRPTSSWLNLDLDYLDPLNRSIFTYNHSVSRNKSSLFRTIPHDLCRDDSKEMDALHDSVLIAGSSSLLILGSCGNIVTYGVFKQESYRNDIMASMFCYLSVLDTLFLWAFVSQIFIKGVWHVVIIETSTLACVLLVSWSIILMSLANWLLVVITLARLVHLKCPLRAQSICSKFNYTFMLVVTHLFVIGVHGGSMIYVWIHLKPEDYNSDVPCYYQISREEVQTPTLKLLYLMTNFLGPAFLLIIFNTMIIQELRAVNLRRKELFNQAPISSSRAQGSDDASTRDQTQNALGLDNTLEVPFNGLCMPKRSAYTCSIESTQGLYSGEPAAQTQRARDHDKDTLTSLSYCKPLDKQRWEGLLEENTPAGGHHLAQKEETSRHSNTTVNKDKARISHVAMWAETDSPQAFGEIEVGLGTTRHAVLTNLTMGETSDVLRNSNHNQSVAVAAFRSHLDLGADSNANPQPSQSHPEISRAPSSVKAWLSQSRTHGINMDDEEEGGATDAAQTAKPATTKGRSSVVGVNSKWVSRTHTLTWMLLSASAVFLLLNTPFWVFHLGQFTYFYDNPEVGCVLRAMIVDFFLLLRYSNNSINFIFYCAVGSRFRQDLYVWFRKLLRRRGGSTYNIGRLRRRS